MPETILETPDSVARAARQLEQAQAEGGPLGEKLILNMGPSHPSTHGVLRILLELDGEIVTGSFTGDDVPADIVTELRSEAQRWPSPWSSAIDRSLAQGDFIATPVAEYLPTHLIRGSTALIGDAAHVVSPVTGAGFHNGLLDVHALSTALRRTPRERIDQALTRYQQLRLPHARRLVTQSRRWSSWYVLSTQVSDLSTQKRAI